MKLCTGMDAIKVGLDWRAVQSTNNSTGAAGPKFQEHLGRVWRSSAGTRRIRFAAAGVQLGTRQRTNHSTWVHCFFITYSTVLADK